MTSMSNYTIIKPPGGGLIQFLASEGGDLIETGGLFQIIKVNQNPSHRINNYNVIYTLI